MKNSILIIITIIFFFTEKHFTLFAQQNKEEKTVLILLGLSPAQPAYQPILESIRQIFTESFDDNYDIHSEFLETESYQYDSFPKEKFDVYNEKYRDIKLDLLICVGRNTTGILKKYAEKYLLNLPVVSMDLDFSNYGYETDLRINNRTAIVGMQLNVEKMISTAISLFPQTSSIYLIGGTTRFDRLMMSITIQALNNLNSKKKIEVWNELSMDRILHDVKKLPKGSLILVPSFNTDSKNVTYYNPEAIRLISKMANSPVFAFSDMGFGEGAIGGYILSFRKAGLYAGEVSVKILNGADPNLFNAAEKDYYEYTFDWRELERWNIVDSKNIPEGSTIMFEEVDYFENNKWILGSILLFIVLQTILIANLIRLNRNQKLMTKKIIQTENKYRDFLHEDRSLRLGQLSASLSHELNQPLTAILSNAQAGINFINSNQTSPELLKQIFQKIVDSDKRGASILNSIRGMLKLEDREKEKIDLNIVIQKVVDVYRSEAKKFKIKMFVHISNEPVYVLIDKIQIQQVILNFIFNAAQSMQGSNTKDKMVEINQTFSDGNVVVSVRDYGKGIDESIKDKLFKPFVSAKKDGMGIGLTICSSIIEDHNGKIRAENKQNGGAEFSFTLKRLTGD